MKCKKCGSTRMKRSVVGSIVKGVVAGAGLWAVGGFFSALGAAGGGSSALKQGAELITHGTKKMGEGLYRCEACGRWDTDDIFSA